MMVEKGETYAIMGMSGAGKSTLLKCIGGLVRPTSGQILIDGTDISGMDEQELMSVRRRVGMVFQYAALFDSLSVFDNVAFGVRRLRRLSETELERIVEEKLKAFLAPKMRANLKGKRGGNDTNAAADEEAANG
jgi:phospholipid/cholesterol/gamma-HCH transport system ATP-binding protein